MTLRSRLLAIFATALFALGAAACTTEDLPSGSGESVGDEPGTDADVGPGVQGGTGGTELAPPS